MTLCKDRGLVGIVPNHSQPGTSRRRVVNNTLCLLSPPLPPHRRKDTVPIAQHQYLTIAYVIFHSSYRWQSRDLICTNAISSFSLYALEKQILEKCLITDEPLVNTTDDTWRQLRNRGTNAQKIDLSM